MLMAAVPLKTVNVGSARVAARMRASKWIPCEHILKKNVALVVSVVVAIAHHEPHHCLKQEGKLLLNGQEPCAHVRMLTYRI